MSVCRTIIFLFRHNTETFFVSITVETHQTQILRQDELLHLSGHFMVLVRSITVLTKWTCGNGLKIKYFLLLVICSGEQKIDSYARRSIAEREADLIARGRGHVIDDLLRQMWQEEIDTYGNMVQERLVI